jgi:curved DNA-binding protein CbpA
MTLYETLGVSKTASKADVKRAFRKKAKSAHPDAGGTAEDFAKLSKAYRILSDPQLRLTYDTTGNAEPEPDNDEVLGLQIALQAVEYVLAVCERRAMDPCSINVIKDARTKIEQDIAGIEKVIAGIRKTIRKAEKLLSRFKAKKGKVNRIEPLIQGRIAQGEITIGLNEKMLRHHKRGWDILGDHTFDFDGDSYREPQRVSPSMLTQFAVMVEKGW